MAENYIRTDEAEDVAGSIRHAIYAAHLVGDDPGAWKWVMLALHSALQGACVCHLTTTAAPIGAVTERNTSEWLTYFEKSIIDPTVEPPKTHLMALPGLLRAVRKPGSIGNGSNDLGIAITESEMNWLNRFHKEIRNQFIHFEPIVWSIEVSGIPKIARLVARITGDILAMGWAFRHQDRAKRDQMQRHLYILERIEWPQSD